MTYVMGVEKPSLDDELLLHYGVLGMKWGKSRARASGAQIMGARGRVRRESQAVARADNRAAKIDDPTKRALAEKNVAAQRLSYLNNPDRVTAARMTRGEKAAALAVTWYVGGTIAGVGAIAGTSARSRRIERKQETGAYTKKAGAPDKLQAKPNASSTTKRVVKDYNDMDETAFKRKYASSKSLYAKRMEKYDGDPYMNSPLAKIGKRIPGNK